MTFELHVNGTLQVELKPEGPVEKLILEEMVERAAKGAPVALAVSEGGVVVSVAR